MDRALIQRLRFAAAHTGEVMLVTFHRGIESLACRQMPATDFDLLMQFAQIAVDRCQSHGSRLPLETAMQLLAGHFKFIVFQLLKQ